MAVTVRGNFFRARGEAQGRQTLPEMFVRGRNQAEHGRLRVAPEGVSKHVRDLQIGGNKGHAVLQFIYSLSFRYPINKAHLLSSRGNEYADFCRVRGPLMPQ